MNITAATPGANFTVAQVRERAATYGNEVNTETEPYRSTLTTVNDWFVSKLDRYENQPELTLGELKAQLDATAASEGKKGKILGFASLGLLAAGFLGPAVGLPSMVGTGCLIGAIGANMIGSRARATAAEAEAVSGQLAEWGVALTAQQAEQPPQQQPPQQPPQQGQAA